MGGYVSTEGVGASSASDDSNQQIIRSESNYTALTLAKCGCHDVSSVVCNALINPVILSNEQSVLCKDRTMEQQVCSASSADDDSRICDVKTDVVSEADVSNPVMLSCERCKDGTVEQQVCSASPAIDGNRICDVKTDVVSEADMAGLITSNERSEQRKGGTVEQVFSAADGSQVCVTNDVTIEGVDVSESTPRTNAAANDKTEEEVRSDRSVSDEETESEDDTDSSSDTSSKTVGNGGTDTESNSGDEPFPPFADEPSKSQASSGSEAGGVNNDLNVPSREELRFMEKPVLTSVPGSLKDIGLKVIHPTGYNVVARLSKLSDTWCYTEDPKKIINVVDKASTVSVKSSHPDDTIEGSGSAHSNSKPKKSVEPSQGSSLESMTIAKAAGSAQTSSSKPKNTESAQSAPKPTNVMSAEPGLFIPFKPEILNEIAASADDAPYVPPWKRFQSPQNTAQQKPAERPSLAHLESIVDKLLPVENSTRAPPKSPSGKSGKATDQGDVAVPKTLPSFLDEPKPSSQGFARHSLAHPNAPPIELLGAKKSQSSAVPQSAPPMPGPHGFPAVGPDVSASVGAGHMPADSPAGSFMHADRSSNQLDRFGQFVAKSVAVLNGPEQRMKAMNLILDVLKEASNNNLTHFTELRGTRDVNASGNRFSHMGQSLVQGAPVNWSGGQNLMMNPMAPQSARPLGWFPFNVRHAVPVPYLHQQQPVNQPDHFLYPMYGMPQNPAFIPAVNQIPRNQTPARAVLIPPGITENLATTSHEQAADSQNVPTSSQSQAAATQNVSTNAQNQAVDSQKPPSIEQNANSLSSSTENTNLVGKPPKKSRSKKKKKAPFPPDVNACQEPTTRSQNTST